MAIKDLNNKRTGDKLYASEWNDVMNEILAHFKNKRIHEDIVVTTGDENLLIYKDTNDVEHLFVLYPKEGTTYGELFIVSVNNSQLDEHNIYNVNNVSSEENTIDFKISYSRAVNIDGRTDHYETTGAIITALELPQGLSVIGTPTDSTISIKVPENQEYNTKNYLFNIKVSMDPENEDALNTKTFTVNLTQNAKDATYHNPEIISFKLLENDESTALSKGKILSRGGYLMYYIQYKQQYGENYITNGLTSDGIKLIGDKFTVYSYDDNSGKLKIHVDKNEEEVITNLNFTITINLPHDGVDYTSDPIEKEFIQNAVTKTITYSNPSILELKYHKIPQTGTSSDGITPYSYKFTLRETISYDNGEDDDKETKTYSKDSSLPVGVTVSFREWSGDYKGTAPFDTNYGTIVKTTPNTGILDLDVAKVNLIVSVNGNNSEGGNCIVQLAAAPSAYYAYVSTGEETQFNLRPLQNGENNVTLNNSEGNGVFFFSSDPLFNNYQGGKIIYTSFGYESSPQDFPLASLNYTVDSTGLKGGSIGTVYYALSAGISGITTGDKFKVTII